MNPHYHYIVLCGSRFNEKEWHNATEVSVEATSSQQAIDKAKVLIDSRDYFVRSIRECFVQDNREIQELLFQEMKRHNEIEEEKDKPPWE